MADPAAPTGAELAFLFADEFVERRHSGMPVPCRDRQVALADLIPVLIGIALWELRARGSLTLERSEKRVLFVRRPAVTATVPRLETGEGLEGRLSIALQQHPDLEDAIGSFYPGKIADPYAPLAAIVAYGLVRTGLLVTAAPGEGGPLSFSVGEGLFAPRCELIYPLNPQGADLASRWREARASDPVVDAAVEVASRALRKHLELEGE